MQAHCCTCTAILVAASLPVPAAALSTPSVPRRLRDGDVFMPEAAQRLLHTRTVAAMPQTTRQRRELIGRVPEGTAQPGRVAFPSHSDGGGP